jgi:hypothetical protein
LKPRCWKFNALADERKAGGDQAIPVELGLADEEGFPMASPELAPITYFLGSYCSHLEHLHVGSTEQNLPHRILGQKIMRDAQFVARKPAAHFFLLICSAS